MADRKRRTAPSREFIREREESSRNRRPSRNRYQEDYDSDDYDDYDEEEYDDEYEDDYDEDYEEDDYEEEPQSLRRRKCKYCYSHRPSRQEKKSIRSRISKGRKQREQRKNQ